MDSQKAVLSKTVIPRKISQITTSQNVENQLCPTLRSCGQYQKSLYGTQLARRDSQAPYLLEPIFCCLSPNFPSVSSICWQVSILHQELEGARSIQGYKMTFSSTPHHERISKAVVSREEGLLIYHRGGLVSQEKGYFPSKGPEFGHQDFLFHSIYCPQEGW